MKLPRLRTFTLWTGTLLCVLIAAAFVMSVNSDSIAGGFGGPSASGGLTRDARIW